MTKINFLLSLHEKLSALPPEDVEERLRFYSEMIEDRMEEGVSEAEAVAAVGPVEEIVAQILGDMPPIKQVKGPDLPKRKRKVWEIVLLALGSPVWLSLLVAAFAVALSLYASLWAVVISFWAVFVSLAACALVGIVIGTAFALSVHMPSGLTMIGAGLVCGGLAIFLFFGCKWATKATCLLAKRSGQWIKTCFVRREAV